MTMAYGEETDNWEPKEPNRWNDGKNQSCRIDGSQIGHQKWGNEMTVNHEFQMLRIREYCFMEESKCPECTEDQAVICEILRDQEALGMELTMLPCGGALLPDEGEDIDTNLAIAMSMANGKQGIAFNEAVEEYIALLDKLDSEETVDINDNMHAMNSKHPRKDKHDEQNNKQFCSNRNRGNKNSVPQWIQLGTDGIRILSERGPEEKQQCDREARSQKESGNTIAGW